MVKLIKFNIFKIVGIEGLGILLYNPRVPLF